MGIGAKVVGIRGYTFTAKDTGEVFQCYEIHCTKEDSRVQQGVAVVTYTASERKLDGYMPRLGDEVLFERDEKGKVSQVHRLNAAPAPAAAAVGK